MIDLSEFKEKKEVAFWAGGFPASSDDFADGERIVVKASDGTKEKCRFSKKLISFLEEKLTTGEIAWVSITRS